MNAIVTPLAMSPSPAPLHDEPLYEIVHGQRVELPPMSSASVWLASCLGYHLGPFVTGRRLGRLMNEGLFILDQENDLRRRPDLAFVSAQRWPLDRPVPAVGDWPIAPDVAIEVISPNDLYEAVLTKVLEYFRHDVVQVWLISPTHRLVYVFDGPTRIRGFGEGDVLTDVAVPGYSLKLSDLFQQAT